MVLELTELVSSLEQELQDYERKLADANQDLEYSRENEAGALGRAKQLQAQVGTQSHQPTRLGQTSRFASPFSSDPLVSASDATNPCTARK